MKSAKHLRPIAAPLLLLLLAGCLHTVTANDVPRCEDLVPPALTRPVEPVPLPDPVQHEDGHQDALPWQDGFVGQTGQLDKANERAPAVDFIYRGCLKMHRDALDKSTRGFLGRLFG